jgi:1,4-alpha-glucan branching enzyme
MVRVKRGNWVEFNFFRPEAHQVCLVGDFNGWQIGATPMRGRRDGNWIVRLRLPAGHHRFRYHADGQWYTDFAAFGLDHGPFGTDSLLWVPTRTSRPRAIRPKPGRLQ